jgi:hypothetical protein
MEFRVLWLDTFVDPGMAWSERAWVPGRRLPWFGRVPVLGAHCSEDAAAKLRDRMIMAIPELVGLVPFALSRPLNYPDGWRLNITYGSSWEAIQALASNTYVRTYTDAAYGEDADREARPAKNTLPRQLVLRLSDQQLAELQVKPPAVSRYTFSHSVEQWPQQAPVRAA